MMLVIRHRLPVHHLKLMNPNEVEIFYKIISMKLLSNNSGSTTIFAW